MEGQEGGDGGQIDGKKRRAGEWRSGGPTSSSSHSAVLPFSNPASLSDSSPFQRVNVAGIEIDNLSEDEALSLIDEWITQADSRYMVVVNAAKLVGATRNEELRRAIVNADLVTADGMSVVWAARLLREPLKQRVTGIDLFEKLVGNAAARGAAVYFLGARDESVRGVVERFTREYPNLRVAGYRNGYFTVSETAGVAEEIRRSGTDLLFVAMGSPKQDIWIPAHMAATGVRFALGVGGAFDHLSGLSRRAPEWMQRAGLEWLFRLSREPRRLWRRYLMGNSVFIWLIARQLMGRAGRKPK